MTEALHPDRVASQPAPHGRTGLRRALLGAGLLAALAAGCASPSSPPVLLALPAGAATPAKPAVAPASASAAAPEALLVGRVTIPEYLVARRVRYRADASTLAEWPHTFWAERIEVAVMREFVAALRRSLPGWTVCEASCAEGAPQLNLQLNLDALDYLRASQRLQARARIVLSGTGAAPRPVQALEVAFDVPAQADNAQAHAQAITEMLNAAAQAVVPMVQKVR